jgi:glycerophosphoryl diester phosphodiesterase
MPGEKHSARVEARITALHSQLKITPDQESKWSTVADAMRDNASSLDELAQQRASMRTKMNAVDDLKSYEAIADAHADGLKKLVPAFSSLYGSMSDAQKKNADQVFAHRPATARHKSSTASHS